MNLYGLAVDAEVGADRAELVPKTLREELQQFSVPTEHTAYCPAPSETLKGVLRPKQV